jgi:phospholipid/cholesterol/gamma-HCH transport system permease protein
MSEMTVSATVPAWRIDREGADVLLRLSGDWLAAELGTREDSDLRPMIAKLADGRRLRFDATHLGRWDSGLAAFLRALETSILAGNRRLELDTSGLPHALRCLVELARSDPGPPASDTIRRRPNLIEQTGTRALASWRQWVATAELLGEGLLSVWPALTGRAYTQASDLVTLMRESGSGALGIVAVVNCLVGAILAFVGAIELRRFGAAIYSADLVGIAVIREMAAVMTAIVMAGRTGGAYAAQIATMQGNEEIDALKALGIPVHQYIVFPRIAALVTMMPLLYLYGSLLGLAGGFVVSILMLNIAPALFLAELRTAVALSEFYLGLIKSICFGAFIAIASCRIGLDAGRSAADVGNSATRAVVSGIIGVIAIDAVFAMCADVLGF